MSDRTPAQRLLAANVVLIAVMTALLAVCLIRQLWFPAAVFALLIFSNSVQVVLRRRTSTVKQ